MELIHKGLKVINGLATLGYLVCGKGDFLEFFVGQDGVNENPGSLFGYVNLLDLFNDTLVVRMIFTDASKDKIGEVLYRKVNLLCVNNLVKGINSIEDDL